MDLHLFLSPPLHSIITIFFILILVQTSYSQDYEQYMQCTRPFQCGIISDVRYPFWANNRSKLCGHDRFELKCEENKYPVIVIDVLQFRVLNINQSGHRMTIARIDLLDDDYCTPKSKNTTLNYDFFAYADYTNYQNLSLFYNCSTPIQVSYNFGCPASASNYYVNDSVLNNHPEMFKACKKNIRVPVLNTTLDRLSKGSLEIDKAFDTGFDVEYSTVMRVCEVCNNSGGSCVNDSMLCLCDDRIEPLVCPRRALNGQLRKTLLGVSFVLSGMLLTCIVFCCYLRMKSSTTSVAFFRKIINNDKDLEAFIRSCGTLSLKRYNFSSIKRMTNSFKDKLGQGGYGGVYKGKLLDGRLVAVKVLNASKGNGEEFINEVASISRTSHVNIVTLLGFCLEGRKRALVYEFMPNGSLEKYINNDITLKASYHLGWEKLYQIAIGVARGLEYLHRGCNTRILHFDIKPHNILLDEDFCPKVSDFGLAKQCTKKESIISMLDARGTIGYIAPEVFNRNFGGVSYKSDVYSYGMMVLEMVGGRNNIDVGVNHTSETNFPHWVYKRLELDTEFELHGITIGEETEIVRKMTLVGLWCIQTKPSDRPSMSKVIEMLEGNVKALEIPPRPFLSSPLRSSPTTSMS